MLRSVLVFVGTIFLASCGSDSGGGTGPDPAPSVATSLTVSPATATLDALGETTQLSATVKDQNGQTMSGASVSWSSENAAVLSVSSSGLGTAVAVGNATVRATSGSASGTAAITVQQVPTQLQMSLTSDNVLPGGTMQASAAVMDAGGNTIPSASVTWSSADTDVATVAADGLITGLLAGLAYIKATVGSVSDSLQVSVGAALQQEQMTILTNANGEAAIYSELGGGTHLQIVVEDEGGEPLAGATIEYGEDDEKAYMAVRRDGYAPGFVFGTVEELKEFGEPFSASPAAVQAAYALAVGGAERAVADAVRIKIELPNISGAALSVIQGALQIQTFFHRFGPVEMDSDGVLWGRKCMTWDAFAQLQMDRLLAIPGWVDGVMTLIREEDPSYFDREPVPGEADVYFSAKDVVNFLNGDDLLAEKINLLGAMVGADPKGRMVEVEWDFGDSGPPVRQGLGTFKVRTNDLYCGGAIPDTMYADPGILSGPPGATVSATVVVENWRGIPVPEVTVTFVLENGQGSLSGDVMEFEATTDENGKATVKWTFPSKVETYILTARTMVDDVGLLSTTITGTTFPMAPGPEFLATGGKHTCGLTSTGQAYCWGRNAFGELGNGDNLRSDIDSWASSPEPVLNLPPEPFKAIYAGTAYTCALDTGGKAYCWGRNDHLQVGNDDEWTDVLEPQLVDETLTFESLAVGSSHSCGLTDLGTAYCWGNNQRGQLGDRTTEDRSTPTRVSTFLGFSSLYIGGIHTCGIELAPGTRAFCWGANDQGQLGLGTGNTTDQSVPVEVAMGGEFPGFQTLATGWYHTCGTDLNGTAYCWGKNGNGQLGNDDYDVNNGLPTPTEVVTGVEFSSLTAGAYHTCGVTADNSAYCWGRNLDGMLGDGTTLDRHVPTLVDDGNRPFSILSAGSLHTCGLTPYGEAWCWGDNSGWQLGQAEATSGIIDLPEDKLTPHRVVTAQVFGGGG